LASDLDVGSGPVRFTTTRRVEFVETDAAGIVHFSAFFVYMEQAEHQLLRHLGLGVFLRDDEGEISWPRVSATCDYRGPARFEDEIQIEVTVERVGEKSETDAAGIVHFSAFFVYMEQAEHQLLRHLGLGVFLRDDEGEISWPRVSATCDYRGPARFEDEIQIEVTVGASAKRASPTPTA
jgi:YbgC/YbaW family acyl-CoA thioester hydrolase